MSTPGDMTVDYCQAIVSSRGPAKWSEHGCTRPGRVVVRFRGPAAYFRRGLIEHEDTEWFEVRDREILLCSTHHREFTGRIEGHRRYEITDVLTAAEAKGLVPLALRRGWYCKSCGLRSVQGTVFCTGCGERLQPPLVVSSRDVSQPYTRPWGE
jgi:hypothetical protein